MERIEPEQLYDERGGVSRSRMIFQGDVFDGIDLPGFGDTPHRVQVVAHPCAMRSGVPLNQRITVAPVQNYQRVEGDARDGNLRVMPLAELVDGKNYATKFIDITAAPSELLTLDRRIATLSDTGIYVLQQRLIKHYTRFEVDIPALAKESASVLWEMHQQRDWIETVLEDESNWTKENLEAEELAFDLWLREGEPSRRDSLKSDHTHTDLRKQVHVAAMTRRAEVEAHE